MKYFRITTLISLFIILFALQVKAQKEKKVLFIGADGIRGDVLRNVPTPNIDQLNKNAIYSFDALNIGITISGPGWSYVFTGVLDNKHKVVDNSFKNHNLDSHPDFLSIIKEQKPELQTAAFYTWLPIKNILNNSDIRVECKKPNKTDAYVHRLAQDYLRSEKADVTVVYYASPDVAGHGTGFDINNPNYYNEIIRFDRYVGDLIEAINQRANRNNEEWLIVSTTDHGGFKTWHGGKRLSERNIFFIVAKDNMPAKELKRKSAVPIEPEEILPVSELQKFGFDNVPTNLDIAPTILSFLNMDMKKYDFDGKSILR